MRPLVITKSTTSREEVLQRYLREVSRQDMISADEEAVLAKRIREGDKEAVLRLAEANLRFVISVAKQYQNHGLPLTDLISEGNLGLLKAAERFDERRGFKFISYAVWWIRQTIAAAITDHSRTVRLPSNQMAALRSLNKSKALLEQELEREPSPDELAELMDLDASRIDQLHKISAFPRSFDAPTSDDSSQTLVDIFIDPDPDNPDQFANNEYKQEKVRHILSILSERERNIVCAYYGIGLDGNKTLDEIGSVMGLTRERVRQIRENAVRKMRTRSSDQPALLL